MLKKIKADMEELFKVRKDVFKALENARAQGLIGKSLEAHVVLHVSDAQKEIMDRVLRNAAQWFIVSKVTFTSDELEQFEVCQVKVERLQVMYVLVAGTTQNLKMKMDCVIVVTTYYMTNM